MFYFHRFKIYSDTVFKTGGIKSHRHFRRCTTQPGMQAQRAAVDNKRLVLVLPGVFLSEVTYHLAIGRHIVVIPCKDNALQSVHSLYGSGIFRIYKQVWDVGHSIHIILTEVYILRQLEYGTFSGCFSIRPLVFRGTVLADFIRHGIFFYLPALFQLSRITVIQQHIQASYTFQGIPGGPCPGKCRRHGFEVYRGCNHRPAVTVGFSHHKVIMTTCCGKRHQGDYHKPYKMLHTNSSLCSFLHPIQKPDQASPRRME